MRRFCVFCGEKPVDKNREHVVPQWLVKYTGDPNRLTLIGKKNGKERKITWLNFAFPACESCNTLFGKIEAQIQLILIKIDKEKLVSHDELDLFMDWLDKVRIGMWLGHAMFDKKDFEPNFFINSRVGKKDRMCLIYKIDDDDQGIGIIGSDTLVFENTPSCFTMMINNMVFFSYSKEFLLAENLGFPFPDFYSYDSNMNVKVNKFLHGKYKVTTPIIDGKIIKPAVKLYQCILDGPHDLVRPSFGSGRSYYNSNCLAFRNRLIKSRIFISDDHSNFHDFWPKNQQCRFKFSNRFDRILFNQAIAQTTLEHQNHAISEPLRRQELMEESEKKIFDMYYDNLLAVNNRKITEIKKLTALFVTVV